MNLNEIKNFSYSTRTYEDWLQKVLESLKGKSVDSLNINTYEDILLKPFYTSEDVKHTNVDSFPGKEKWRRGNNAGGYISNPWKIAQQLESDNPKQFKMKLISSFEQGQTAISFKPYPNIIKNVSTLLEDVYTKYPFCINGANGHHELIEELLKMPQKEKITGFIGKDPISLYAKGRKENIDIVYDQLYKTIQKTASVSPQIKTLLVNTSPYHHEGANAVQELAIAIATAVFHIEQLKKRGMDIHEIVPKIVFHFAIGQNFFMEVAKLRAGRVLLSKVLEAYEVPEEKRGNHEFSAETSKYTKSAYDPYVNILRAGNEAFAAVLGGVQYLHVSAFDEPLGKVTEFSERIARNIQLILKEESGLRKIIDPAGGSWYIEWLTEELINRSWSFFLEIDNKGGMIDVLNNNWLQKQISEVRKKREEDILSGKQTIVGVNKYREVEEVE